MAEKMKDQENRVCSLVSFFPWTLVCFKPFQARFLKPKKPWGGNRVFNGFSVLWINPQFPEILPQQEISFPQCRRRRRPCWTNETWWKQRGWSARLQRGPGICQSLLTRQSADCPFPVAAIAIVAPNPWMCFGVSSLNLYWYDNPLCVCTIFVSYRFPQSDPSGS